MPTVRSPRVDRRDSSFDLYSRLLHKTCREFQDAVVQVNVLRLQEILQGQPLLKEVIRLP